MNISDCKSPSLALQPNNLLNYFTVYKRHLHYEVFGLTVDGHGRSLLSRHSFLIAGYYCTVGGDCMHTVKIGRSAFV